MKIQTIGGIEIATPLPAATSPSILRIGYYADHRRTNGLLPDLSQTNNRLKLRFEYRFTEAASFSLGANLDLDPDTRFFDGGSAILIAGF